MGGSGVVRLHASLVLFLVFVNFCLTKKEKKGTLLPFAKVFPLQMKCFLIFAKVFYAKFVPKITIRESFCQKFRDFLISRKFLLAKFSAPKVTLLLSSLFSNNFITCDPRKIITVDNIHLVATGADVRRTPKAFAVCRHLPSPLK